MKQQIQSLSSDRKYICQEISTVQSDTLALVEVTSQKHKSNATSRDTKHKRCNATRMKINLPTIDNVQISCRRVACMILVKWKAQN